MSQDDRDKDGREAKRERERMWRPARDQLEDLAEKLSESDEDADEIDSDDWDQVDTNVTQQLERRIRSDPATRVLYAKIRKERKRRESGIKNALLEVIGETPPAERMTAFARTLRRLRMIIVVVAIPAGSSALLVGKYLISKSAEDERVRIEREILIQHDHEHEARLREIEELSRSNAQRLDDIGLTLRWPGGRRGGSDSNQGNGP